MKIMKNYSGGEKNAAPAEAVGQMRSNAGATHWRQIIKSRAEKYTIWLVLLVLIGIGALSSEFFLKPSNLLNVLRQVSNLGISFSGYDLCYSIRWNRSIGGLHYRPNQYRRGHVDAAGTLACNSCSNGIRDGHRLFIRTGSDCRANAALHRHLRNAFHWQGVGALHFSRPSHRVRVWSLRISGRRKNRRRRALPPTCIFNCRGVSRICPQEHCFRSKRICGRGQ